MNDRFKFRAFDTFTEKMIQNHISICEGELYEWCPDGLHIKHDIGDSAIVMQSTGLKDKNGKLIYEGDVVKTSSYRCNLIVTWFKNKFILVPYSDYQDKDKYASERINGYRYFENNNRYANERDEVIGNIYENPELLKECE